MRSATTLDSNRSPRNLGKILPRLGSPTWWPARPIRCKPLATEPGDSTCTTRSTAPMSMPSSRLLVATIARRRPDLSASSTSSRCSRAIEPWWVRTRSSSASSLSWAARRSASRRPFTNTIVERWARISSSSLGWIAGQIEARAGPALDAGPLAGTSIGWPIWPMSSMGTTTSSSMGLRCPASTIVTPRAAPRSS